MSHQPPRQNVPDVSPGNEPSRPFITDCHRNAVETLGRAFANSGPLAILIGEGRTGANFVVQKFLTGIKGEVAVVRLGGPCSNAIDVMREIVTAIGFDPKEMNLTDLEQIFRMFLSFQKTHSRRTIICFEETQDHGRWVLDRIRRLVEAEIKGHFGLFVILSGRPALNDLLNEPPLNAIGARAAKRISLVPFTLAETREYIRRRVEGTRAADIGQVFAFDAVTAIQEVSSGIPDKVTDLCSKCLELADLGDTELVTTALVDRAAKLTRLASMVQEPRAAAEKVQGNAVAKEEQGNGESPAKGQLIAYVNDAISAQQMLNGGHVLIGRDELCDIRLDDAVVSRHHALVVNSSTGVKLVDLGSRNGTFVNGRPIRKHTLQSNDKITLGKCRIEFVAGDDHHAWYFDTDPTATLEPHISDRALTRNGNGFARQSLDSTRTIVSHGARSVART